MDYNDLAIKKLTKGGFKREESDRDFDALVKAFDDVANKTHIGMMLVGGVGCGKTLAMRAMAPVSHFIELSNPENLVLLQNHTRWIEGEPVEKWWMMEDNTSVILDDLGNETMKNEYGVKTEVVSTFIMRWYSTMFKSESKKARIHITTNLDFEQLTERYGERVTDRIMEMCSVFHFTSKSNRPLAKSYGAVK